MKNLTKKIKERILELKETIELFRRIENYSACSLAQEEIGFLNDLIVEMNEVE